MEIEKIGCNSIHDKSFKISRPAGYPCYLLLYVKSPALFEISGKNVYTEKGSIILYDRHYPHYYAAAHAPYVNDWIHIHAEHGTDYFTSLGIPLNTVIPTGEDSLISDLIKQMSNEYFSINPLKQTTMDLLLQTMFVKLSERIRVKESKKHRNIHYANLVSLREQIYANPQNEWTVEQLAARMNLCSAYFHKIYRSTFGISCMADVIQCKLGHAKDLLSKTFLPVHRVAVECGYKHDVHFMRQFKKYIGLTPTEYRKTSFREQRSADMNHELRPLGSMKRR